ncbi:MAG TPA: aminotransferase class I/II-fold pyridoxal phosphate-dependent enzyme [Acidobacteriota bacterium]|nr:aminotransferase class I/II-fold pyridoxal phosphate-dependent enzyme [bacterium]HNX19289.1 aminotransferase class I/II-fold pyridoxal phosphate-dependent enzyme [Acidobacteriota bacterium]
MSSFGPIRTAARIDGVTYAVRDVVALANQVAKSGKKMIYLNIGDPCKFDFRTPEPVVEAIVKALRDNQTSYSASEGLPEAREAIRRDAEERKGIKAIREIFVGHGASEPIETLLTALLEPGEGVLVPSPGYPLYGAVLAKLGARAVHYDLDEENGWQPDVAQMERLCDDGVRAVVLINPNNPTGSVAGRETLEKLLDLAARRKLVVLSDEIYDRMLIDPETKLVSTASLRDDVPIATFGGLSKVWLGPGLRIGWSILSGPEDSLRPLLDAMGRLVRARLCANHPVQWAVKPALEGPNTHVAEVNAKLRRRRDLLVDMVNAIPGWHCVPPRGAFYAFPKFDIPGLDDLTLVREMIQQHGVVLVHGSGFGQKEGTQHVRIVFLPQEELLKDAFTKLAEYTRSRR